jgi:hypothetical protein
MRFVGPKRVQKASSPFLKQVLWAGFGLLAASGLAMTFPPFRARVSLVRASAVIWFSRGEKLKKAKQKGAEFVARLERKISQSRSSKSPEASQPEAHRPTPAELLLKKIGAPHSKDISTSSGSHGTAKKVVSNGAVAPTSSEAKPVQTAVVANGTPPKAEVAVPKPEAAAKSDVSVPKGDVAAPKPDVVAPKAPEPAAKPNVPEPVSA